MLSALPSNTYQLNYFGITDVGQVRDHNEDAWAAFPESGLFILADGMGGHSAGEIASKESIEQLADLFHTWYTPENLSIDGAKNFFREAIARVNSWIYERGEADGELKGMGTTLCSLFLQRNWAILAHVGDSRIYRMRNSILDQLTEDHSLVAELMALGAMDQDESETFPYRHILTRAIGTHPKVDVSIKLIQTEPSDLFMLCSDGLNNYVSPELMAKVLGKKGSLSSKGQTLIDLANENGGGDNISLILVEQSALV